MKVCFLFNFTESVTPPRCRKPRTVTRDDGQVLAEVNVLSGDQAPVAIRASGKLLGSDTAFTYDLRWWDGRLWSAVSLDASGEPRGRNCSSDDWKWPAFPDVLDLRQGARNQSYQFEFFGNFGSNPRDEVEANIHAFAKGHCIIDGVAHRVTAEPCYVAMTFGLRGNHGGTSLTTAIGISNNLKRESQFSVLDLPAALAYATKVAEQRGDTNSLPMKYSGPAFEVFMPAVLAIPVCPTDVSV